MLSLLNYAYPMCIEYCATVSNTRVVQVVGAGQHALQPVGSMDGEEWGAANISVTLPGQCGR